MTKARQPSPEAIAAAASSLGCEVAAVRAVASVEAGPHGAFLEAPGEPPVVLFERHVFSRITEGRHDGSWVTDLPAACSLLSHPVPGGYGPVGLQHARLEAAMELDRDAARAATSWGLFQIMGFNHGRAGHPTLDGFVRAMWRSVDDHLQAFVAFIYSDARLALALKRLDWPTFARLYNGPGYATNRYDLRLLEAYRRFTS